MQREAYHRIAAMCDDEVKVAATQQLAEGRAIAGIPRHVQRLQLEALHSQSSSAGGVRQRRAELERRRSRRRYCD
jgi:hypothetical protein